MARHGWLGVLPRHPHNSTCVRPSVMGIRVVSTIEWLQGHRFQKQKANIKTATTGLFGNIVQSLTSPTKLRSGNARNPLTRGVPDTPQDSTGDYWS